MGGGLLDLREPRCTLRSQNDDDDDDDDDDEDDEDDDDDDDDDEILYCLLLRNKINWILIQYFEAYIT